MNSVFDEQLFEELEQVRSTGAVNMLDKHGVQRVADELELSTLVVFLEDADRKAYGALLKAFGEWRETHQKQELA
jgi:hypothetical protein